MAGDSLQFKTAISWENENVAQIFYDLLVKIGIAEKQIAASSYFGAVEIGTLYEGVSGGTTVKVAVNIPIVIATGETIILSEGVTSEELVVSAGNAEATSYPPYITLTTGTISNTFTTAATVTWKKRTSLDTGFNFDEVYDYFDRFDYVISHCFDRELSYLQAAEIIGPHGHCFNFTDMMGRERIHVFKPVYESIDQVSYNDTLLAEGLTIGSAQIINRLVMNYAFDCENDEYTGKLTYPNDDDNLSYIRNGFLREKAVYLPGWYNAVMAERVAAVYFNLLQRGLKLISFQCKIDEMFRRVGERVELVSYYPQFSEKVEIIGVGISVDPKSDIMIEFVGYAYEAINNNVFYLDVSKMDNGAVLW